MKHDICYQCNETCLIVIQQTRPIKNSNDQFCNFLPDNQSDGKGGQESSGGRAVINKQLWVD
jgi:hypothetical protein